MKKFLIIFFCMIVLIFIIGFFSLDYIGDLIFQSIIENEYSNLNDLDELIDTELQSIDELMDYENNEIDVEDGANNKNISVVHNKENKETDENVDTNIELQYNDGQKENNIVNKENKKNNTNIQKNNSANNSKSAFDEMIDDMNENLEDYDNLMEYEVIKEEMKEEEEIVNTVNEIYEVNAIQEIKDSVETKDKLYVATKVITKLSKDELVDLVHMLSGGITLEEKIEAIKIVNNSFNKDQIEEIRDIYHKYVDQLETDS